MSEIQQFAKEFGIFAALFTFLLLYVLRENSKREKKYTDIIERFASIIDVKLDTLEKTLCDFVGVTPNKKRKCK